MVGVHALETFTEAPALDQVQHLAFGVAFEETEDLRACHDGLDHFADCLLTLEFQQLCLRTRQTVLAQSHVYDNHALALEQHLQH